MAINRDDLRNELKKRIAAVSKNPVELNEENKASSSYALGQRLGYCDGLKYALDVLDNLPEDKPQPTGRYILGDPRTFQYAPLKTASHPTTHPEHD